MNNIFTFLLPHTTLDWFFFSLLLGWLAFSLVAAKKAKNNVHQRIHSSHFTNIKASFTELSTALRDPKWDHIVENAPGFALVLGLLGTFLGIGLAIEGAGRVLLELNNNSADSSVKDMRATMQNLSPILAEIGMKFKVSTWGIITHIILRCSIPFFKIDETRQEAISKYIKEEHYAVVKEKENFQHQLLEALKKQNELSEKMLSRLEIIVKTPMELEEKIETLSWSIIKFEKTVDDFNQKSDMQLKNLNKNIEYLKEDTLNVLKNIDNSVDNVRNDIHYILTDSEKNILEILTLGLKDLGKTNSMLQTAIKNWETSLDYQEINLCLNEIKNINPAIDMIGSILQDHSNDLNKLATNSDEEINILQTSLGKDDVYQKIDQLIDTNNKLELLIIQNIQAQQQLGQILIRSSSDQRIRLG